MLLALGLLACGPGLDENFGVTENEGSQDCDGLLSEHCLMPFPSDYFRSDGHLLFGQDTLPLQESGVHIDGSWYENVEGYGVATPILLQWAGLSLDGLPEVFQPEQSLAPDSRTIVLDASTGERVAHWTEFDHYSDSLQDPVLVMRMADSLAPATRYVVAIRGAVDRDGATLPATDGFAALRDQQASTIIGIHQRRDHYEDAVFPLLEQAGVERSELQLAWDFTTNSDANSTETLLEALNAVLAAVPAEGPAVTIEEHLVDFGDPWIAHRIEGTVEIPSVLLPEDDRRIRLLRRDSGGAIEASGVEVVEFTLQVPYSVAAGSEAAPVLQYGHGFLGDRGEADNGWLRDLAERKGFSVLAIDMQGMSEEDSLIWLPNMVNDGGTFPLLAEKPIQGLVNHVVVQDMVATSLQTLEGGTLTRDDGGALFDGDRVVYTGNSQGGTMGNIVVSLSSSVKRGVLGVPGCCYPLLLQRSSVFTAFADLLTFAYPDPVDFALVLGLLATGWDRLEGLNYARHSVADPFEGTPAHQILLHVAKEDAQVHNQASFVLGRGFDAVLPVPAIRELWGFETVDYPFSGGVSLVEFDFGWPEDETPMDPPVSETDTHGDLRRLEEGQDQLWHFLMTGEVIDVGAGTTVFDPQ
jgi:hypothetical protein